MVIYSKSFASHYKSIFWSKKNNLSPKDVYKSSPKKYIFDCSCGHEFIISLNHVSSSNKWCGYCSTPANKLCDNDRCEKCYEKSFASHPKSEFWSKVNEIKPRQVFKNSYKSFIFNCNKCDHL